MIVTAPVNSNQKTLFARNGGLTSPVAWRAVMAGNTPRSLVTIGAKSRNMGRRVEMKITEAPLNGKGVRLEPATDAHREELMRALDCDADNWAIQYRSAQGEYAGTYWRDLVKTERRITFVAWDMQSGKIAGTSSYLNIDTTNSTLEIGGTWFRPEFRGTTVNPAAKLVMLSNAFACGAERVQFTVDSRNERSRRAMAKLGAVEEGIIRRHLITWTGHKRDSFLFSIIADDWPKVRNGLSRRLDNSC
jgi:N-acetyltransferase